MQNNFEDRSNSEDAEEPVFVFEMATYRNFDTMVRVSFLAGENSHWKEREKRLSNSGVFFTIKVESSTPTNTSSISIALVII